GSDRAATRLPRNPPLAAPPAARRDRETSRAHTSSVRVSSDALTAEGECRSYRRDRRGRGEKRREAMRCGPRPGRLTKGERSAHRVLSPLSSAFSAVKALRARSRCAGGGP